MDTTPAAKSAATFLFERTVARRCDAQAVSCCERCSTVFLAAWTLERIADEERTCHGCGRVMSVEMWGSAPATPGMRWQRDCPDCANVPAEPVP